MATGESSEAINSIVVVRSRPNLHPLLIPHPPPTSSTHHILLLVVLVLRLLLLLLLFFLLLLLLLLPLLLGPGTYEKYTFPQHRTRANKRGRGLST